MVSHQFFYRWIATALLDIHFVQDLQHRCPLIAWMCDIRMIAWMCNEKYGVIIVDCEIKTVMYYIFHYHHSCIRYWNNVIWWSYTKIFFNSWKVFWCLPIISSFRNSTRQYDLDPKVLSSNVLKSYSSFSSSYLICTQKWFYQVWEKLIHDDFHVDFLTIIVQVDICGRGYGIVNHIKVDYDTMVCTVSLTTSLKGYQMIDLAFQITCNWIVCSTTCPGVPKITHITYPQHLPFWQESINGQWNPLKKVK